MTSYISRMLQVQLGLVHCRTVWLIVRYCAWDPATETMGYIAIIFILAILSTGFKSVHGSKIQCGECQCIEVRQNFLLDCENLDLTSIPDIDDIIRRHVSHAYMKGNNIQTLNMNDFEKWYSLEYIDLTNNPGLLCTELAKIPSNVKVQVECLQRPPACKYIYKFISTRIYNVYM